MKARARELGLTDAAVARALGVGQRRYSAYANESREPDFGTLARICHILRTTPDAVLGFGPHPDAGDPALVRIAVAARCMEVQDRERAAAVMEALVAYPGDQAGKGEGEGGLT